MWTYLESDIECYVICEEGIPMFSVKSQNMAREVVKRMNEYIPTDEGTINLRVKFTDEERKKVLLSARRAGVTANDEATLRMFLRVSWEQYVKGRI